MRVSAESTKSGWERCALRRSLAVRAIAATQRRRRALHQLQPRWELLSARHRRGAGSAHRCEFRDRGGSLARATALSLRLLRRGLNEHLHKLLPSLDEITQ